jgi:hypothetical protein
MQQPDHDRTASGSAEALRDEVLLARLALERSRKSGCAIAMSACAARRPTSLQVRDPYSVTTYMTSVRGVVTTLPGRERRGDAALRTPFRSYVR